MTLIEHIESYLGSIDKGWSLKFQSRDIQVVKILNCPSLGVSTYATLGMSDFELNLPNGKVRQELIFSIYDSYDEEDAASFLLTFAESILHSNKGLLRGEVIGPGDSLVSGAKTNSIYVSIPVVFDERVQVYSGGNGGNVVFAWIMPLQEAEVRHVNESGWNSFEDNLSKVHTDFWDLNRPIMSFV